MKSKFSILVSSYVISFSISEELTPSFFFAAFRMFCHLLRIFSNSCGFFLVRLPLRDFPHICPLKFFHLFSFEKKSVRKGWEANGSSPHALNIPGHFTEIHFLQEQILFNFQYSPAALYFSLKFN